MSDTNVLPMSTVEVTVAEAPAKLAVWKDKASKVKLAFSAITKIESESDEQKATALISKANKTLNGWKNEDGAAVKGIIEERKDITAAFDEVKAHLMQPEKDITSEINRVKALLNASATAKLQKAQEEQQKLAANKEKEDEKIRIKGAIRNNVADAVVKAINAMSERIKKYAATLTLDKWDDMTKIFYKPPVMRMEDFQNIFLVTYNATLVTQEEKKAIDEELKQEITYNTVNADYTKHAQPTLDLWIQELPNIKAQLESGKALSDMGATTGAAVQQASLQEFVEEKKQEAVLQTNADALKSEINHQVQAQTVATPKGVRASTGVVIECAPKDIVKVFGKILFALYASKGFRGHIKLDKKGNPLALDANGIPQYQDWADQLLSDLSKLEPLPQIEGVRYVPIATKIARASS